MQHLINTPTWATLSPLVRSQLISEVGGESRKLADGQAIPPEVRGQVEGQIHNTLTIPLGATQ